MPPRPARATLKRCGLRGTPLTQAVMRPCGMSPRRPPLLLNGLSVRYTAGFAAGVPTLEPALGRFLGARSADTCFSQDRLQRTSGDTPTFIINGWEMQP
jgi:hypothetical protein